MPWEINNYTLLSFIKIFIMNFSIYYTCNKVMGEKIKIKNTIIFGMLDLILSGIYAIMNSININLLILILSTNFILAIIISKLVNGKLGYSIMCELISYALSNVALLIGSMIGFIMYKRIFDENEVLGVINASTIQFVLLYFFFKIKRLKNGFAKLYKKLNTDLADAIIIMVSIFIIIVVCFMGSIFQRPETIMKNIFITFIILAITMYIMIHRTITMQYKHSLLLKTLEEYKEEIAMKDKEIEKLSAEKFNTSKIRHEFYNRQKALELIVKQNMSGNMDKLDASENILKIVNELTSEYSKECEIIKGLVELPKTNVVEIDNIFKYMQTECAKNNIDFKLNIQDSIEPLLNTYISKSRLETLLGDHIRDAINAVNKSSNSNKEIMVVLGLKDGYYEICILDNGVEFGIDTLLKLGKEQVTTGGTGIGFLTTFETLRETKASLVITEYNSNEFTKSVAFVFNNKCEYIVNSYRGDLIVEKSNREDIIINKIEG